MYHIFTKSWRVVFYTVFLAFILCGYEAGACISTPDEVKLPGSTFTAETITVEESEDFKIRFGNTIVYHSGRCWFYENDSKCLHQWQAEAEKKYGQFVPVRIVKNNVFLGLIEFDDRSKTLWAYSVSPKGQKDTSKPYLEFRKHKGVCSKKCARQYDSQGCNVCRVSSNGGLLCPKKGCSKTDFSKANKCVEFKKVKSCSAVQLTMTAYARKGGPVVGTYVSNYDPDGAKARGLTKSLQGQKSVVYLKNKKRYFSSGCGFTVKN